MTTTFFERFFGALDGPDPVSSLDFVAEDVRFAIFWTAGAGRESEQHLGGKDELRRFVEAGGGRRPAAPPPPPPNGPRARRGARGHRRHRAAGPPAAALR